MVAADDERFKHIHPNCLHRVRYGAKYISHRWQSYDILPHGNFWYVKPFRGGRPNKSMAGLFQSFNECEDALIRFLKATDRHRRAYYPGDGKS